MADLERGLRISSMTDVETSGTLLKDKLLRLLIRLKPVNFLTWFYFKFLV